MGQDRGEQEKLTKRAEGNIRAYNRLFYKAERDYSVSDRVAEAKKEETSTVLASTPQSEVTIVRGTSLFPNTTDFLENPYILLYGQQVLGRTRFIAVSITERERIVISKSFRGTMIVSKHQLEAEEIEVFGMFCHRLNTEGYVFSGGISPSGIIRLPLVRAYTFNRTADDFSKERKKVSSALDLQNPIDKALSKSLFKGVTGVATFSTICENLSGEDTTEKIGAIVSRIMSPDGINDSLAEFGMRIRVVNGVGVIIDTLNDDTPQSIDDRKKRVHILTNLIEQDLRNKPISFKETAQIGDITGYAVVEITPKRQAIVIRSSTGRIYYLFPRSRKAIELIYEPLLRDGFVLYDTFVRLRIKKANLFGVVSNRINICREELRRAGLPFTIEAAYGYGYCLRQNNGQAMERNLIRKSIDPIMRRRIESTETQWHDCGTYHATLITMGGRGLPKLYIFAIKDREGVIRYVTFNKGESFIPLMTLIENGGHMDNQTQARLRTAYDYSQVASRLNRLYQEQTGETFSMIGGVSNGGVSGYTVGAERSPRDRKILSWFNQQDRESMIIAIISATDQENLGRYDLELAIIGGCSPDRLGIDLHKSTSGILRITVNGRRIAVELSASQIELISELFFDTKVSPVVNRPYIMASQEISSPDANRKKFSRIMEAIIDACVSSGLTIDFAGISTRKDLGFPIFGG